MFFSVLHRLSLGHRSVKWLENPQLEAEGKNPFSLDSKEPQWYKFQDYLKGNKEFLSRCARTIISMSLQR